MNNLIFTKDNSIEPKGAIGRQKCGIIFWQKTGFLRHCNKLGLKSIVTLIDKKFSPSSIVASCDKMYFIYFDNDENKEIYLTLKKERNSKHLFIYGESHTVYADAEFHILALQIASYIAKQIGCKFFVDDATGYLEHRSKDRLEQYIKEYIKSATSKESLKKAMIEHHNRTLDINEILSRKTKRNVVVDAYEYYMRQSKWEIADRFNDTVKNFLLCVMYNGEIGCDSISGFYSRSDGNLAPQIADALHTIGAIDAEEILRESFALFPDGIVPEDEDVRKEILAKADDDFLHHLDCEAYDADIDSFCYQYLMNNKSDFIE